MDSQLRFFFFMLLFLWIMSSNPNPEEKYPSYIDKPEILKHYKESMNISRNALLSDYNEGYGNISGFHLSYQDAVDNKTSKLYPIYELNHHFIEDEKYSILPNFISRQAANIWNSEDHIVDLPSNRNDSEEAHDGVKYNTGAYPLNITGFLKGNFKKSKLENHSLAPINITIPHYLRKLYEYRFSESQRKRNEQNNNDGFDDGNDDDSFYTAEYPFDDEVTRVGNFTEDNGSIRISIFNANPIEDESTNVSKHKINGTTPLSFSIKLNNAAETDEHRLSFSGVYHQKTGNLVVASNSAKFNGFYALPHLQLQDGADYEAAKWILFNEANKTDIDDIKFQEIESLVDSSNECEYIGYFHMESTNLTREELQKIDYELINPVGRPHKNVPDLKLTKGLLYSPNCAILLEVGESVGLRDQIYEDGLRNVILVGSIVIFLQILVLIRQMSHTNTPSTLSKLSFWTIAIINMADGSLSVVSLLCTMFFSDLYIQFVVCAFLAFSCSAIYEMKYGIQIYCTQINERTTSWRTMLQGITLDDAATANNNETINNGAEIGNPEATAVPADTNNNTNTPVPPPQTQFTGPADEQSIGAELYTRHFFSMLVFLFVLLNVITWPKRGRQIFEYIILTIFNSYWIPQIYRNTLRGSRSSFTWEFVLCTSFLRLIPIIYIESFANPFEHHTDMKFVLFLVIWLLLQIGLLFAQEILGPRFFLQDKYLPKVYDYHPVITKGDLESGFNFDREELISDGSSSSNEDSRTLTYVTDCAICMQKLSVPILNNSDNLDNGNLENSSSSLLPNSTKTAISKNASNLIARRKYMVTPCNHIFHTECLEQWMVYKLQCPVCRNSLPPC
ncbi:ubiquitin-protein ligase [Pichia kluyveri]|uniref:RING-type E3 ubiquitin transferase n=1 Tax=Pichia kluyveri TaxID=36015 RepID=A0AAV5RB78_PICKL|nr:ubiquitin-protein ligase [Pichia kluyveri]